MRATLKRGFILLLVAGLFVGFEPATIFLGSLTSEAEARIGRPATPVSVAGVARRTTRRCVTGAYNC